MSPGGLGALRRRLAGAAPAPERSPLVELKLRTIDAAFALSQVTSVADLGGVWAVEAGYSFFALEHHGPERAVLVDDDITPAVRERAAAFARLELLEQNFGLERTPGDVGPVRRHPALRRAPAPGQAGLGRDPAALRPARAGLRDRQPHVGQRAGDRPLLDLGEERYREAVPPQDNLDGLYGRLDEVNERRGRLWRDVHDVWQWGITDADLQATMAELGFTLAWAERKGRWNGLLDFEERAYVFGRAG